MLLSILIYFITFLISCFACKRYEVLSDYKIKNNEKNQKNLKKGTVSVSISNVYCLFWAILIVAPPVLLATFRGMDVGTDTQTYLKIYNINKSYNILEYLNIYGTYRHDVEIGYQQILHVSYTLEGGYNLVKCLSEFLIIYFFWRGALYYHKKYGIDTGLCMFFFYLLEFTYGINGVRYGIALSLFFWGFQFVIEKKLFKYLFCCLFMMLFHQSLLIAVPFYLLTLAGSGFLKKYRKLLAIIAVVIIIPLVRPIVELLLPAISMFSSKFGSMYASSIDTSASYGFGMFIVVVPFLLPLIKWSDFTDSDSGWTYIMFACITFIPLRLIGYYSQWLIRLSRLPEILFCVLFCGLLRVVKRNRVFWYSYTFILLLGYYFISVLIEGSGEVYPYVFDFTNYI